jgi:hypothetical protein
MLFKFKAQKNDSINKEVNCAKCFAWKDAQACCTMLNTHCLLSYFS